MLVNIKFAHHDDEGLQCTVWQLTCSSFGVIFSIWMSAVVSFSGISQLSPPFFLMLLKRCCRPRGAGTGGAVAPPIFLEIGNILSFSTPNISRLKEGSVLKKSLAPPIFYTFRRPCYLCSTYSYGK